MNSTFTVDDGLPEDVSETQEQHSDESMEMINHSDISDPKENSNPPSLSHDQSNVIINEVSAIDDEKDIPGDPFQHRIKQVLEKVPSLKTDPMTETTSQPKIDPAAGDYVNEEPSLVHSESIQSETPSEASQSSSSVVPQTSSSSGSFEGEGGSRRKTYHVRHNTVTIASPENVIAKEVASVLNELADSDPESLMTVLQQRLTEYAIEKENQVKGESGRSIAKAKALLEMKKAFEKNAPNPRPQSRPPSPTTTSAIDVERLIRERDQSHEHATATMRSLREIIRQQELLMDKEFSHSEHIRHIQTEIDATNSTINQLHNRYNALLVEAEEELLQADVNVNRIRRELDDSMVTLRFKTRQQEMAIRSHETMIENLQAEKKELLDICEDLVAHTEANHPQEQLHSPQQQQEQRQPEMDDIGF